jgi:hypothetical protein
VHIIKTAIIFCPAEKSQNVRIKDLVVLIVAVVRVKENIHIYLAEAAADAKEEGNFWLSTSMCDDF